jgi:peptide/nickel transport system ATP-binding protein
MVFQDPFASLNPRMTIGRSLDDAIRNLEGMKSGQDRRAEAARVLGLVGVPESALDRYPHQFSGGQRQRIAIARALAVRPEVVIMDEVTSALDVSVQATVLNLLKDLQRDLGLTYLFISHDLAVVGTMSDSVAVMYRGRIVEMEATSKIFEQARHPYTRALIASIPHLAAERVSAQLSGDLPDPRQHIAGCPFHTRCPVGPKSRPGRTVCLTDDPLLIAEQQPHRTACHFAGTPDGPDRIALAAPPVSHSPTAEASALTVRSV